MKKQTTTGISFCIWLIFTWTIFFNNAYGEFSSEFNLANLDGTNGYIIENIVGFGNINGLGDINGDGINDILIGACLQGSKRGGAYVIFGSKEKQLQYINLNNLNGTNGFSISGAEYLVGWSVSILGDVNGDGIDDFAIGAPFLLGSGASSIIFGREEWPKEILPFNLNGTNGFSVIGEKQHSYISTSLGGAGDINGDGINDILISEDGLNKTYVIFGTQEIRPSRIFINSVNGTNGFVIDGIDESNRLSVLNAISLDKAGDINADGIDDIIIGSPWANNGVGASYIIFGSQEAWPISININDLNGTNGFLIKGINRGDRSGAFVSGVGDINNDNIDDIIIGAQGATINANQAYVIFGSNKTWSKEFNINDLNGDNGFSVNGIEGYSWNPATVSNVGDFNADNITDIMIGVPDVNRGRGQVYVIFGSKEKWPAIINLENLNGSNGFVVKRDENEDDNYNDFNHIGKYVHGIGDVNGDEIDDILIGDYSYKLIDQYSRESLSRVYIVFGFPGNNPTPPSPPLSPNNNPLIFGLTGGAIGATVLSISSYCIYRYYYKDNYQKID